MKYIISIISLALVVMFQMPAFASDVDLTSSEMKLIHGFESNNKLYSSQVNSIEYKKIMKYLENPGSYRHVRTNKLGVYRDGNGDVNVKYRIFGKYTDTSFGGWETQPLDITVIFNATNNSYWVSDFVYR